MFFRCALAVFIFRLCNPRRGYNSAHDSDDSHGGSGRKRDGPYRLRLVRAGNAFNPEECRAREEVWQEAMGRIGN